MNYLNSLLKPGNRQHLLVIVLLTLYIVLDVKTPRFIAVLVDSLAGNLAVAGFVIALLCKGTNFQVLPQEVTVSELCYLAKRNEVVNSPL